MLLPTLIALISLALAALFLYQILGPREVWDFDQAEGSLTLLQRRRDRILRELKDLEREHEAGSVADGEFYRLRQELKLRAIQSMKDLDRVRTFRLRSMRRKGPPVTPSLRRRIDNLVAKRKEST